jgi:hypothetical protein
VVKLLILFQLDAKAMLVFLSSELVVQAFLILNKVNWINSLGHRDDGECQARDLEWLEIDKKLTISMMLDHVFIVTRQSHT